MGLINDDMTLVSSAPKSNAGTNTRLDELTSSFWGGVFALLVAFIPFSPLIGGFAAECLKEGKRLSEVNLERRTTKTR